MGQLFVVNDCITQEQLLKHISRKFILKAQKKTKKTSYKKNKVHKSTELNHSKDKKAVKNNNVDVCQLYSLKDISSSSQTFNSQSGLESMIDFHYMDEKLKESSKDCHVNEAHSNNSGSTDGHAQIKKNRRKRKRNVITADEIGAEDCVKKHKQSCGLFKKNMSAVRKLKAEIIISGKDDNEDKSDMSGASFEGRSTISCDNTSVLCPVQTFTPPGNLNFCFQQDVESSGLVSFDDEVNNKCSDSKFTTCQQLKTNVGKKRVGRSKKVKRKTVKDRTTSSECDSKKFRKCYPNDHTGDVDRKLQSVNKGFENGVSEMRDIDCTPGNQNESFCLGRVFDNEDITLAETTKVVGPKCEGSHKLCNDPSLKLSAIKNIPDHMYVAVDCEMVGVGPKGRESVLARCSIVDYDGNIIYDKYVRPSETITDYRTRWSGIRPQHMKTAVPILIALRDIKQFLEHKVVIGHAVYHDFKVLGIVPDHIFVRDTAQCKQLVEMAQLQGMGNSLKKLSEALLDRKIQGSMRGHCSVEDARATLDLFKLVRRSWEPDLYLKWSKKDNNVLSKIANFVDSAISPEDFLNDKFWPSHILD